MKIKLLALLLLGCTFQATSSYAATAPGEGGVSLGATRLVYPSDKSQITVKIYNTNQTGNFLVQSWVSDENGKKVNDFVVTPPLFVLKANTDNVLRLVYTGDMNALPKDKEKIFFFNSKVIPSLTEEQKQAHNALLIATTTKIKIFMRPSSLAQGSLEAYKKIQCSYANNKIKVTNPTAYYMNLVSLQVNGKDVTKSATIAPNADVYIDTTAKGSKLTFEAINDYGALANSSCNLSN